MATAGGELAVATAGESVAAIGEPAAAVGVAADGDGWGTAGARAEGTTRSCRSDGIGAGRYRQTL